MMMIVIIVISIDYSFCFLAAEFHGLWIFCTIGEMVFSY